MSDIAIRVESLSKLYPAVAPRACSENVPVVLERGLLTERSPGGRETALSIKAAADTGVFMGRGAEPGMKKLSENPATSRAAQPGQAYHMNEIAVRVENYILSGAEGLSKLYPAVAPNSATTRCATHWWPLCHEFHEFHEKEEIIRLIRVIRGKETVVIRGKKVIIRLIRVIRGKKSEDLWALKDISFEVKQGVVVGRNGAGTLAPASVAPTAATAVPGAAGHAGESTLPSTSDRRSALRTGLKILSRITVPTSGRADVGTRRPAAAPRPSAAGSPACWSLRVNGSPARRGHPAQACRASVRRIEINRHYDELGVSGAHGIMRSMLLMGEINRCASRNKKEMPL